MMILGLLDAIEIDTLTKKVLLHENTMVYTG